MKIKRAVNQVAAIAKTDFLGVLRNKTAIFFTAMASTATETLTEQQHTPSAEETLTRL
jgi:hypothetical protein